MGNIWSMGANLARDRPRLTGGRPGLRRMQLSSAKVSSYRANFGTTSTGFGRSSANFGQLRPELGRTWPQSRHSLGKHLPRRLSFLVRPPPPLFCSIMPLAPPLASVQAPFLRQPCVRPTSSAPDMMPIACRPVAAPCAPFGSSCCVKAMSPCWAPWLPTAFSVLRC